MKTKILIVASAMAMGLISCSSYGPSDTYTQADIGETMEVKTGKIVGLKNIIINPSDRDYGTLLGAAGGALAGNTLGGGTGKTLFTAGGLLAGAMAGNQIDKAVNQVEGYQVEIKIDGENRVESVRQVKDPKAPLWNGQKVKLYKGYKASRVEGY